MMIDMWITLSTARWVTGVTLGTEGVRAGDRLWDMADPANRPDVKALNEIGPQVSLGAWP